MGKKAVRQDWASRKAVALLDGFASVNSHHRELLREEIATLLRRERRRAVRKCVMEKVSVITVEAGDVDYNQACDDCATAIKGKP